MQVRTLWLVLVGLLASVQADAASTDGWYQVELIVFANNSTTDTDEVWPLNGREYPRPMISIGPSSSDDIRPKTLGQLEDLEGYFGLWQQSTSPEENIQESNDFMFESRRQSIEIPNRTSKTTIQNAAGDSIDDVPDVIEGAIEGANQPGFSDTTNEAELTQLEPDFEALFISETAVAYKDLPNQDRILGAAARSVRRSSMYRLLAHHSWLQPIVSEAQATPILIQGGKRYDSTYELDGTVTISRSRFLHIDTDLWFTQFTPLAADSTNASVSNRLLSPLDGRLAISPGLREKYPEVAEWMSNQEQYIPVNSHHLAQSRRMRSATLHFIDHPGFGVLIKIERFEPEDRALISQN